MLYASLCRGSRTRQKHLAVLLDPDNLTTAEVEKIVDKAVLSGVDYFFVGGSLMVTSQLDSVILTIKSNCNIPVILFPGSIQQISHHADALLFLSLISGRNPEMLIGNHVLVAPYLKASNLEVLSTGYMLVDGGRPTTVSYMSNSTPIPADKPDIAMATAMAGELLGLKLIYLDAGSGAQQPVPEAMVEMVRQNIDVPVIVGGGITTPERAERICRAGADLVVVGNAIEKDISLIKEMSVAIKALANEAHRNIEFR